MKIEVLNFENGTAYVKTLKILNYISTQLQ